MATLPTAGATLPSGVLTTTEMVAANRKTLEGKGDLDRLLKADVVTRRVSPQVLNMMGVLERGLIMSDAILALHAIMILAICLPEIKAKSSATIITI